MSFPPRPVDTTHTHFTDQLVDPAANAPFDAKAEVEAAKELPAANEVTIYQASVTLTDAQIKALPSTPAVILPATSGELDYSGFPATLYYPVMVSVVLDARGGGYTNLDAAPKGFFVLAWGSDWSVTMGLPVTINGASDPRTIRAQRLNTEAKRSVYNLILAADYGRDGDYFDNALVLALDNGASGPLTGGNAANTLKATVWYGIFEV